MENLTLWVKEKSLDNTILRSVLHKLNLKVKNKTKKRTISETNCSSKKRQKKKKKFNADHLWD
jgi:hypothetical protein